MGNCQAIDTATLVIQHPCGKVDKLYWPVCASEIMKANPGHYVALLISTTLCPTASTKDSSNGPNNTTAAAAAATTTATSSVRVTRIKLLRPTDTLVLGQVYRLITAQEVMKVLSAKKYAKMKKGLSESAEKFSHHGLEIEAPRRSDVKKDINVVNNHHHQVGKSERHKQKTTSSTTNSAATPRPRTWQPSLQSISEAAS